MKGDTTEPALSPEAQSDLDGLARDREGFRTERDNAARTVNDLAQRHGIDGSALRSKTDARVHLQDMVRRGQLSETDPRSILDAVTRRDNASGTMRTTSQAMGEHAARDVDSLMTRDPNVRNGLRRFIDENPNSPTAAALRDGSIEIRYELVQARPGVPTAGQPIARTRVTELVVQRDRIHLPDLQPKGIE